MDLWKTMFFYQPVIFRFHVNLPECINMILPLATGVQTSAPAQASDTLGASEVLSCKQLGHRMGSSLVQSV